jgi:hypothetical protein
MTGATVALDIFFGLDDSLSGCTQNPDGTVQSGAIESVSFSSASALHSVQITVTARLGRAAISAEVLNNFEQRDGKNLPTISTVVRQYRFLFNGWNVVPDAKNPPRKHAWAIAPRTSYRAAK